MQSEISVIMVPHHEIDLDTLAADWLTLEKQGNRSFFLTWAWIGNWLKTFTGKYYLLKATSDKQTVGLSIIVKTKRKVFGFIPVEQWWLNRTGEQCFDQCWIEENDFLLAEAKQEQIRAALLAFIKADNSWHELNVGMASRSTLDSFSVVSAKHRVLLDDIGYAVNYADFNDSADDSYQQHVLSRNTRQKLRQSEKLLKQAGQLSFKVFSTNDEKKQHLSQIAQLHIQRWQNTATPSGFVNQYFQQMLEKVIAQAEAEFLCLFLNDKPVAYLVNFIYQEKVYFYLSALAELSNNKIKLGMLLQQKAIEHYQALGLKQYDFLAGDARYKKSLTNHQYQQQMACFYRSHLVLFCEQILRSAKGRVKQK